MVCWYLNLVAWFVGLLVVIGLVWVVAVCLCCLAVGRVYACGLVGCRFVLVCGFGLLLV